MTVTHNGRQYSVTKMADGETFKLVSVSKPLVHLYLTTFQMSISGLLQQIKGSL